jgi:nucleotide-binding universal stress UspA family protein
MMIQHRDGRVVLGVSQSLAGLEALRYAVAEARRRQTTLYAVRTCYFATPWQGSDVDRWRAELTDEARRYVEEAFDLALGGPPADVDVVICTPNGRTDAVLTRLADDRSDILVLGAGRSRRLLRDADRFTVTSLPRAR